MVRRVGMRQSEVSASVSSPAVGVELGLSPRTRAAAAPTAIRQHNLGAASTTERQHGCSERSSRAIVLTRILHRSDPARPRRRVLGTRGWPGATGAEPAATAAVADQLPRPRRGLSPPGTPGAGAGCSAVQRWARRKRPFPAAHGAARRPPVRS